MNVTLYAYNLLKKRVRGKDILDVDCFENDFVKCIEVLSKQNKKIKSYKLINKNKIIYIDRYEYFEDSHILFLVFKSAEYGLIRKVVNTETMEEQKNKKKGKRDGDEETTCAVIKFDTKENSKEAVCLLQVNAHGVTLNKIFEYLNIKIIAIHNSYNDNIKYKVNHFNIISNDFLKALEKVDKIKTVKLVIDSELTGNSEFKDYANDNEDISNEFDIIYKPSNKIGIGKNTVKRFFDQYGREGADIKKIRVDTNAADGNPLSFDTEKMKEKEYVTVTDTLSKEPNVDELKVQMIEKIKRY